MPNKTEAMKMWVFYTGCIDVSSMFCSESVSCGHCFILGKKKIHVTYNQPVNLKAKKVAKGCSPYLTSVSTAASSFRLMSNMTIQTPKCYSNTWILIFFT